MSGVVLHTQVTWDRNGNLGKFTNFVNLLNMCGIAVPSGILRGARRGANPVTNTKSQTKPCH